MKEHWHQRYIDLAEHVAQWSEDRTTKVGAVIVNPKRNKVVSIGYNGFPRGVAQNCDLRHERPAKYEYTEHAERNAIYNAGCDLTDHHLYLNFYPAVCSDCTRAVIQSGISVVYGSSKPFTGIGRGVHYDKTRASSIMFKESGVRVNVLYQNEIHTVTSELERLINGTQ